MITAAMVGLDARNEQPTVVSTFTTKDPVTPPELRETMAQLIAQVRESIPDARYCTFLEFTTGKARRSGGQRRPHLHGLWKGVGPGGLDTVAAAAEAVFYRRHGANRHDVQEIHTPAGATMYVARHHLKESQAPPAEWGPTRRLRPSRGYWSIPAADLRSEATAIVHRERVSARWWAFFERAIDSGQPIPEDVIEEQIEADLEEPAAELYRVKEGARGFVEVLGPVERRPGAGPCAT